MDELVANQIVLTAVGMACTGIIGFLLATVKDFTKKQKARDVIDKCVARNEIRNAYELYVVEGKKLTDAHYNELEELFEAYLIRGWNGTGKQWIEEIRAKKPFLVVD